MKLSNLQTIINEYGYTKTADVVQRLYDAGRIAEDDARALLFALSEDASFILDAEKSYRLK